MRIRARIRIRKHEQAHAPHAHTYAYANMHTHMHHMYTHTHTQTRTHTNIRTRAEPVISETTRVSPHTPPELPPLPKTRNRRAPSPQPERCSTACLLHAGDVVIRCFAGSLIQRPKNRWRCGAAKRNHRMNRLTPSSSRNYLVCVTGPAARPRLPKTHNGIVGAEGAADKGAEQADECRREGSCGRAGGSQH